MGNPLFDRRSPRELAERGQAIEKEEKLAAFPQLAGIVAADFASVPDTDPPAKWREQPVAIRLKAGWADERHRMPILTGRVRVRLPAVCQRCLEPFGLLLDRELRLLFTGPGGEAVEAGEYELWELDEPTIRPLDIVEEALIMAMPFTARHEESVCGTAAPEAEVPAGDGETVRPFADLRSRMQDRE